MGRALFRKQRDFEDLAVQRIWTRFVVNGMERRRGSPINIVAQSPAVRQTFATFNKVIQETLSYSGKSHCRLCGMQRPKVSLTRCRSASRPDPEYLGFGSQPSLDHTKLDDVPPCGKAP